MTEIPGLPFHPDPEDVSTIDGILKAFYDVISGPPGVKRNWARDRSLHIPDVRFIAIGDRLADGTPQIEVMDHPQYVLRTTPFLEKGFYEKEVHRIVRYFGNLVHVFSTYEYRFEPEGLVRGRGVNSIQLFYDGVRWWIAGVVWQRETAEFPLTPEFQPAVD